MLCMATHHSSRVGSHFETSNAQRHLDNDESLDVVFDVEEWLDIFDFEEVKRHLEKEKTPSLSIELRWDKMISVKSFALRMSNIWNHNNEKKLVHRYILIKRCVARLIRNKFR